MGVISRFPGGGGVQALNVSAYTSALLLPASAAEGAIGVITSVAIANVRFIGSTPVSPVSGDVWIKGATALPAKVVLRANPEYVLYPLAAYQYVSSAWVSVPLYVYVSGSWVASGTLWLLGQGRNDVAAEKSLSGGTVTYASGAYTLSTGPGSSPSFAGIRTTGMVSLAASLRIMAIVTSGDLDRYRQLVITTGYDYTSGVVASVIRNNTTSGYAFSIDTSALTGSYYIHFITYYPTSPGNTITYTLSELKVVYSE